MFYKNLFKPSLKNLIYMVSLITLYRFCMLLYFNSQFDLYFDEAYYFGWAKHFEFGYYSKPPMIAWVIMLTTYLFGDGQTAIKIASIVVYPITTITVYLIAKKLFNQPIAFLSGITFFTLPSVSFSSMIISTDVPLLLFWALALLFFIKALDKDSLMYWILAGVFGGLGLLSKYNMLLFLICAIASIVSLKKYRGHIKNYKLYICVLIAFLLFLPNFLWNIENGFISFVHTTQLSGIEDAKRVYFEHFFQFLVDQLPIIGPILLATFIVMLLKSKKILVDNSYKIVYIFSVIPLIITVLVYLVGNSHANWSSISYISAIILIIGYLYKNKKNIIIYLSLVVNILAMLLLYNLPIITNLLHIETTSKTDLFQQVKGWDKLAQEVQDILKEYPHAILLTDRRDTTAQLSYYIKLHPLHIAYYNPNKKITNQYELTTNLNNNIGDNFIYVTDHLTKSANKNFKQIAHIKEIVIPINKTFSRKYQVYYMRDFLGY